MVFDFNFIKFKEKFKCFIGKTSSINKGIYYCRTFDKMYKKTHTFILNITYKFLKNL